MLRKICPGRVFMILFLLWSLAATGAGAADTRILMVRFGNLTGEQSLNWIGFALWDLGGHALNSIPGLDAVSWELNFEFLGEEEFSTDGIQEMKEAQRLAKLLNVNTVAAGDYDVQGENITIKAQWSETGSGKSGEVSVSGSTTDLPGLAVKLAGGLAHAVGIIGAPTLAPENKEVYNAWARGLDYLISGQPEKGVEEFNRALELDPDYSPALLRLGLVSAAMGKNDEAKGYFERAIESAKSAPSQAGEALNARAAMLRAQGDMDGAVADLDHAVELLKGTAASGELGASYMNRASILGGQGKIDQAMADLDAAQEVYGRGSIAWATAVLNQGVLLYDMDRTDEAMPLLEQAAGTLESLGSRSRLAAVIRKMGEIEKDKGDNDKALKLYQKALGLQQDVNDVLGSSYTYYNIGAIYSRMDKYQDAVNNYDKALEIQRKAGDINGASLTLSDVGVLFHQLGRYDDAVEILQNVLKLMEQTGNRIGLATNLNNLAMVYQDQGKFQDAVDSFNKSLEISRELGLKTGEARALSNLGLLYDVTGDQAKSEASFLQALALAEELGDKVGLSRIYNNLAMLDQKRGDYAKALEGYRKSLEIIKSLGETVNVGGIYNNMGQVYDEMGDHDKAREYFDMAYDTLKSVGDVPQIAAPMINIGIQHGLAGRWDKAEKAFRLVLGINTSQFARYGALVNLAWTLIARERYEEAKPFLEQALQIIPTQAAAHAHIGYVLLKTGDPDGARREIDKAVELDPGYHEAKLYRGILRFEVDKDVKGAREDLEEAVKVGTWLPDLAQKYLEKVSSQ